MTGSISFRPDGWICRLLPPPATPSSPIPASGDGFAPLLRRLAASRLSAVLALPPTSEAWRRAIVLLLYSYGNNQARSLEAPATPGYQRGVWVECQRRGGDVFSRMSEQAVGVQLSKRYNASAFLQSSCRHCLGTDVESTK